MAQPHEPEARVAPVVRADGRDRVAAVLLVDSDVDSRTMYAESLRLFGFRTIEIDNSADALALATTVDVVVTGIRISGPFDGLELVRRVRADERTQSKPIVVLTACAYEKDRRSARAAGCDVFLTKPCLPATLASELLRTLATDTSRQRPRAQSRPMRRHVA